MKRIILAAAATVLFSTAALADDPFAVAYGNTVTQTLPDGTKLTIYVNADKTWQQSVNGKTTKGTYAWKGRHQCLLHGDRSGADRSVQGDVLQRDQGRP